MTAPQAAAPGPSPDRHGARPKLAWLSIELLRVDRAYQRTLEGRRSQKLIAAIAADFRWASFQAILATPAGGGYLILDGQHRVEAARRCSLKEVPAVVVEAASVAEQADAFVRANRDRVAVNPYALHHARLVSGDPAAVKIAGMLAAAGLSIPRYPIPADKLKAGETLALGTVGMLAKLHGEAVARQALVCIANAFRARPKAMSSPMFRAAAALIAEGIDAAALSAFLATRDSGALRVRALERQRLEGGSEHAALTAILRGDLGKRPSAPKLVASPATSSKGAGANGGRPREKPLPAVRPSSRSGPEGGSVNGMGRPSPEPPESRAALAGRAVDVTSRRDEKLKAPSRQSELAAIETAIGAGKVHRMPSGADLGELNRSIPEFETVDEAVAWLLRHGHKAARHNKWAIVDGRRLPSVKVCQLARDEARAEAVAAWNAREARRVPA